MGGAAKLIFKTRGYCTGLEKKETGWKKGTGKTHPPVEGVRSWPAGMKKIFSPSTKNA